MLQAAENLAKAMRAEAQLAQGMASNMVQGSLKILLLTFQIHSASKYSSTCVITPLVFRNLPVV